MLAEIKAYRLGQLILKPILALGFLYFAFVNQAPDSPYGKLILAGLLMSTLGDVLLLSRHNGVFKAGIIAFLLAHLAYATAFWRQFALLQELPFGLVLTTALSGIIAWLQLKTVPSDFRVAVSLYIYSIVLMLVGAIMAAFAGAPIIIAVAALFFAVSDMAVSRDRFVVDAAVNKIIITPLYFTAQALFAFSISMI
ncbi:MAG: lysoplasmalogenase [bacterium]